MPTFMVYGRSNGAMHADEPPKQGDVIRLDASDLYVQIVEVNEAVGERPGFMANDATPPD